MKYSNPLMNEMNFWQRMWFVSPGLIPFILLGALIWAAIR